MTYKSKPPVYFEVKEIKGHNAFCRLCRQDYLDKDKLAHREAEAHAAMPKGTKAVKLYVSSKSGGFSHVCLNHAWYLAERLLQELDMHHAIKESEESGAYEHAEHLASFVDFGEPDLSKCPGCGGPADNGNDRCVPPSPYYCTTCECKSGNHVYDKNAAYGICVFCGDSSVIEGI